ncbi:MAG: hypothetical protein IJY15_13365, partial [Thermoguttaceae bacterium]|nr:hypothetical protein [Thermoguttaceae bacterium]
LFILRKLAKASDSFASSASPSFPLFCVFFVFLFADRRSPSERSTARLRATLLALDVTCARRYLRRNANFRNSARVLA